MMIRIWPADLNQLQRRGPAHPGRAEKDRNGRHNPASHWEEEN